MKNTKLKLVFVLAIFSSLSCGKDFLTEPPRKVTVFDLLNSPDGAERMIGAVYNQLYSWEVHSFSWNGVSSITSDDADKGSDPGDAGTDKNELDNWTFSASAISFNEIWTGNFTGIGRAAHALQDIPNTIVSAADKDRYMAEAKMLRAYFYFNLVRTFGGVPKIDKVLETAVEIEAASVKKSEAEIYAFIESDLNEAIPKLPATISPAEYGRVSKGAAQALLAKVSLYQKKWTQAKSMADAVIGSGQYSLLTDYAMIWREAGEFSSESIWEVNAKGTTPNKGIEGYFVTQAIRGGGGLGWGFNTPSQNLVDAYEPNDKRKAATIMTRGQVLWDGFQTNPAAPNQYYSYKSYVSKTQESFNGDDWQSNKNLRILRYGEILLIKAESENELNNTSAAATALNQVRTRAGLPNTTAITQTELRDAIWKERRVEMAFEHDRMFDLRRTGRAKTVLTALGINYITPKHDLFPIPQIQIDRSNKKLIQNPGYN
jgi:hypothetical protein